jgi:hypothetical protein
MRYSESPGVGSLPRKLHLLNLDHITSTQHKCSVSQTIQVYTQTRVQAYTRFSSQTVHGIPLQGMSTKIYIDPVYSTHRAGAQETTPVRVLYVCRYVGMKIGKDSKKPPI